MNGLRFERQKVLDVLDSLVTTSAVFTVFIKTNRGVSGEFLSFEDGKVVSEIVKSFSFKNLPFPQKGNIIRPP